MSTARMTMNNSFTEQKEEWFQPDFIEEYKYIPSNLFFDEDENEEDERYWRIYRGQPVDPSETIAAYYEWIENDLLNKWNGLNISATEFVPESLKNKQIKKTVSFTYNVVSIVVDTFSSDEYDRKYKEVEYKYYSNNIGIPENSGVMPVAGQMVFGMAPPVRLSKTCNVLSVLGFEESPI